MVRTLAGSKPTTGFCHLHYAQFSIGSHFHKEIVTD
jgi:hypothetical protein